ncbi:MAG: type II toxin-antitoxin system VapC family toxin [Gemmatimonadaceae bacterium]|nr:type II toxin-antitoxin system VapC family toxin [Gemmatimonadaceae bacterium]
MGVLIDASVLIGFERDRTAIEQRLAGREDEEFFLSVITASELLHGVHRAKTSDVRARRSAFVEAMLARFPLLSIDLPTARSHSQLWADLASTGKLIGPHDLWIAAACIAHGLTLVTANVREFQRVPGLGVESWLPESSPQ